MTEEVKLEQLPVHEIKRKCKEKHPDIKLNPTYKKDMLINILLTGADPAEKKREVKRAPVLKPREEKPIAVLPKALEERLERLKEQGLEWEVDEEGCCVNFSLPTQSYDIVYDPMTNKPKVDPETQTVVRKRIVYSSCANLDQPEHNIYRTALECFPKRKPVEMSRGETHPILG